MNKFFNYLKGYILALYADFRNADLTEGSNLPEHINTKAKWIAECGAGNVNAQTIWIDGTSILY